MALTTQEQRALRAQIEARRMQLLDELHEDAGRDLSELRGLEAARSRMADGGYGQCADCGADIAFERLRANPAAARCIRCQGAREKLYGTATGSSL